MLRTPFASSGNPCAPTFCCRARLLLSVAQSRSPQVDRLPISYPLATALQGLDGQGDGAAHLHRFPWVHDERVKDTRAAGVHTRRAAPFAEDVEQRQAAGYDDASEVAFRREAMRDGTLCAELGHQSRGSRGLLFLVAVNVTFLALNLKSAFEQSTPEHPWLFVVAIATVYVGILGTLQSLMIRWRWVDLRMWPQWR